MVMIGRVKISRRAEKQIRKLPSHIAINLEEWITDVMEVGLEETRKVAGYHDEPLHGNRKGQRSIRLSRSYRAIYLLKSDGNEFVSIEEVSKHEY